MERMVKKFSRLDSAENFAKKVKGKVNDLRNDKASTSKYSVTYKSIKNRFYNEEDDRSPEDDRDFGYSNSFWQ